MNIARVVDGIVVNIEVASQEWVAAQDDPGVAFIEYTDANPAHIGLAFDSKTGVFAQPEHFPDAVAIAYELGKAHGAAEQAALQALITQAP